MNNFLSTKVLWREKEKEKEIEIEIEQAPIIQWIFFVHIRAVTRGNSSSDLREHLFSSSLLSPPTTYKTTKLVPATAYLCRQ